MASFCVIISGRLPGNKDDASIWAPIREGFKFDEVTFNQRVLAALPLLVRQNLDEAAAERLTQQLRASGIDACAQPDDTQLAFLERAGTIRGPLPLSALAMFVRPDERYRLHDGQEWQTWKGAVPALCLSLPDSFGKVPRALPVEKASPPQVQPPPPPAIAIKAQPRIEAATSMPNMPAMPVTRSSTTSPVPQKAKQKVALWKIIAVVWICAVVFYTVVPMIFPTSSSQSSTSRDVSEKSSDSRTIGSLTAAGENVQQTEKILSQSGWTNSTVLFASRWNSMVKGPYQLSPFDADDDKAIFFMGAVRHSHDGTTGGVYSIFVEDQSLVSSACGLGYSAAAGVSADIGNEVIRAAIGKLRGGDPDGMVDLDGHRMMASISRNAGGVYCTIYEHN